MTKLCRPRHTLVADLGHWFKLLRFGDSIRNASNNSAAAGTTAACAEKSFPAGSALLFM